MTLIIFSSVRVLVLYSWQMFSWHWRLWCCWTSLVPEDQRKLWDNVQGQLRVALVEGFLKENCACLQGDLLTDMGGIEDPLVPTLIMREVSWDVWQVTEIESWTSRRGFHVNISREKEIEEGRMISRLKVLFSAFACLIWVDLTLMRPLWAMLGLCRCRLSGWNKKRR